LLRFAEQRFATNPNDSWAPFVLGLAYYRAGRIEQAIQQLSKPPVNCWANAVLAMAHHRLGHVEEARRWLAKADGWYDNATREVLDAPLFSPSRPWLYWWGWAQYQILHREAKVLIEGSAYKGDANQKALQARAREELKRRHKATADHDHALGLYPDQPRLWLARGRRFAELKQWDKADADLAKAAQLKPDDSRIWRERGRIYAEFGQSDKAAADFAKALALWSNSAGTKDDLGQWDELFDRVVKLRPKDAQLWMARANRYGRRGQWPQAGADLAKAIDLDPSDHQAWFQSAAVRLQLGDVEGYRRACRQMLTRFGRTKDLYIADKTAKTCLLAPDAVSDLKPVTELAEQVVTGTENERCYCWFLLVRGMADYRHGRFASALTWIDKCLAADSKGQPVSLDATAGLMAAMAHHQLGRRQRASEALDKAVKLMEQQPAGAPDFDWDDRLRFQIVRREAEALVKGTEKGSETGGR
jgi:tetratricopeptide (TPR) repeat protein